MIFLSIFSAAFFGFPMAWFALGFLLSTSNDRGNSTGSFRHFSKGRSVKILESQDKKRI